MICLAIRSALLIGIAKPTFWLALPKLPVAAAVSMPITRPEVLDQRAAGVALHDAGVGLQHAVQRLLGGRAAVAGRDGPVQPVIEPATGGEPPRAVGVADRDDVVADLDLRESPSGTVRRLCAPTSLITATSSVES